MKIKWIENRKDKIHKQGWSEGWEIGYHTHDIDTKQIREYEKSQAFRKGRDFEFKTINAHMQGMFQAQMSQNVEWVVERFREALNSKLYKE